MSETDACAACTGRRDFLRDAAAAAVGLLVGVGARRAYAQSLDLALARAVGADGALRQYPLPAADGVHIDRDNEVILVRNAGRVYAFALSCPHQRTMLRWDERAGRFQCPKHRSRYTPDGQFISGRATRGMDRYALRREEAAVVVDTARLFKQDEDRAGWEAAFVAV